MRDLPTIALYQLIPQGCTISINIKTTDAQ